MPAFDPTEIVRVLDEHHVAFIVIGGLAAALHGSDVVTVDLDVTPLSTRDNLERLSAALLDLDVTIRSAGEPGGVPFVPHPDLLARTAMLNLVTRAGDLDLVFRPEGSDGFEDLRRDASSVTIDGVTILVASLADVIRSKEAANREKDRLVLPRLRRLLAREVPSKD
jgi:hypothetical protein